MIAWIFSFFVSLGHAGYLQIVSESSLTMQKSADGVELIGDYSLRNQGNETARNVYPTISVDNFTWRGDPANLQPGESFTWRLQQQIDSRFLKLPVEGRFAVVIFTHYEDLNAYPFAIPGVQLLTVGLVASVVEPELKMNIEAIESNLYMALINLKNLSNERTLFQPLYVVPREVELQTPELPLEVPRGGELASNFVFANRTALQGSSYHAFLILRWVENGQRQATFTSANFRIEAQKSVRNPASPNQIFWACWFWLTAIGMIGMWALWVRPLRKFRSK